MDRHRLVSMEEKISMKRLAWIFALLILIGGKAYGQPPPKAVEPGGSATIIDSKGETVGSATLTQGPHSVTIAVEVSRLPPGKHGLHIHAIGKCDPPEFQTAGGHFDPFGKKHGRKNPEGPHAGDLPNLEVGPDGRGKIEATVGGLTLGKEGLAVLLGSNGTAVVIHADPDDERTDPAGSSGARIACGVIKMTGAIALPMKPTKKGT
jgi:Cu-Zn family superoxide dismutase